MPEPLFRRVIGPDFEALPAPIRAVHGGEAKTYSGTCEVVRGTGLLSRVAAAIASLPAAGANVPLKVTIDVDSRGETWNRIFDGRNMRSRMSERDGLLEERIGPTVFRFALQPSGGAIDWKLMGVRWLGVPLPVSWFDKVKARESLDGNRYRFDVRAEVPIVGLLVHYRGTLDP